jgi:predicted methyltransferase
VYAEEIDGPLLEKVRSRLEDEHLTNVALILGKPDAPGFPKSALDAVLIADVYHEIARPAAVLANVRESLKPGGLLIVIDYLKPEMKGRGRKAQAKDHNIEPEFVERDLKRAGFVIVERREPFGRGYGDIPIYFVLAQR